jgi:biofilm PGA synthesis N-glycosyltransferase PgaC
MSYSTDKNHKCPAYVLITAAYNEETYIERTILSVVSQTLPPQRWVIVSDGSTDRTDEIVLEYAKTNPFIELLPLREKHKRNFGAQVNAINAGYQQIRNLDFDFVGNLDADVSFAPDYFSRLVEWIERNSDVGLAGGFIYEEIGEKFQSRETNTFRSVAHAVQLFRRECYDAIGGYIPLRYGGPDWCAEIMARMKGWRVESLPELPVFHHRPTGGGTGLLRYWYQQGSMDYSLGSHPLFEIVKCVRRMRSKPYVLGACARLTSFVLAHFCEEERPVSEGFVAFLRKEQSERLWESFLHPFRNGDNSRKDRDLRSAARPSKP